MKATRINLQNRRRALEAKIIDTVLYLLIAIAIGILAAELTVYWATRVAMFWITYGSPL